MFVAHMRTNSNGLKITIPIELTNLIRQFSPDIRFLNKVTLRKDDSQIDIPHPIMARGSGNSHYFPIPASVVKAHSLVADDEVNVVLEW